MRPELEALKLPLEIEAKLILGKFHVLVRFLVDWVKSPLKHQLRRSPDHSKSRLRVVPDSLDSLVRSLDDAIRLDLSLLQALDELLDHIRTPPVWIIAGRDGGIRTHDLLVPNQALYQAEPHPDK
jgi:hypothetical protein